MKIGSLFAGIGGFDLAAHWMGWETAWFSEIDPYTSAVLAKHWSSIPNHGDITTMRGADIEKVDLLCGGFPCQDISTAGKGAGITGARSGLWSHFARLIGELQPHWVVIENVSALRSRGLDVVLGEIAALGYDAEWHCIPAAAVGAPHRRDRIWIVAYPASQHASRPILSGGGQRFTHNSGGDEGTGTGPQCGLGRSSEIMANTKSPRARAVQQSGPIRRIEQGSQDVAHTHSRECGQRRRKQWGNGIASSGTVGDTNSAPSNAHTSESGSRGATGESSWWAVEPDVGRVAHGVPSRVDRLRCLGNAIVPQVAFQIFQAIQAAEDEMNKPLAFRVDA